MLASPSLQKMRLRLPWLLFASLAGSGLQNHRCFVGSVLRAWHIVECLRDSGRRPNGSLSTRAAHAWAPGGCGAMTVRHLPFAPSWHGHAVCAQQAGRPALWRRRGAPVCPWRAQSEPTEPVSGVAHQFDVQTAVLCAGFAFEAYNEPSPTDARWERGADGCDVAFMSEAFARECYAGRVVVRLLEAEDLPPPVAKSGMAQALLTGADADAYVLFALNEESDNDKSLGTSGLPLFGGSNMFGLTNGAAAPKDGAIGLVRAVDRARSSTVWSNEQRRPRKGRVVWEGDERHALYVKDPARAQLAITVFDEEVSDVSGTCDPQPPSCCNVCLHSASGAGRQGWSHVCTRTPRSTRVGTRAWR